jgi:hypothetical protein
MDSVTTKAGLVAALAGVALLGNMRPAVSEPAYAGTAVVPRTTSSTDLRPGLAEPDLRLLQQMILAGNGDPEDGGARLGDSAREDDGRLVPAIYAWDPEVRFVYYRHVSKWM